MEVIQIIVSGEVKMGACYTGSSTKIRDPGRYTHPFGNNSLKDVTDKNYIYST